MTFYIIIAVVILVFSMEFLATNAAVRRERTYSNPYLIQESKERRKGCVIIIICSIILCILWYLITKDLA